MPPPHHRFSRRYWLRLAVFALTLIAVAAACVLSALFYRQWQIFVTPRRLPITQTPAEFNLPYDDVLLTTPDNFNIAAWYIPGTQPNAIILVHGLNTNRQAMLPTANILATAGYPLLLIDLRGHGQSADSPVTYGYREAWDVQAAAAYLAEQPEIEKIGVLGTSLGGAAVARAAAADSRLQAVVIQSSYSSLPAAIDDAFDQLSIFPKRPFAPLLVHLAEWWLAVDANAVNSARDLARVSPRPVLIIHGQNDHLFPRHHAQTMFNAAQNPKSLWIIKNLDHADPAVSSAKDAYRRHLLNFFAAAFAPPAPANK